MILYRIILRQPFFELYGQVKSPYSFFIFFDVVERGYTEIKTI